MSALEPADTVAPAEPAAPATPAVPTAIDGGEAVPGGSEKLEEAATEPKTSTDVVEQSANTNTATTAAEDEEAHQDTETKIGANNGENANVDVPAAGTSPKEEAVHAGSEEETAVAEQDYGDDKEAKGNTEDKEEEEEPVSPVAKVESVLQSHKHVIIWFYRGQWCRFCKSWMALWLASDESMLERNNIALVAVTSQPGFEDPVVSWKLTDPPSGVSFTPICDPDNTVAKLVKTRGWVEPVITGAPGPYKTRGVTYPTGMVQPACVIIREQSDAISSWAVNPGIMNMGGATDRPLPKHLLEKSFGEDQEGGKKRRSRPKSATWQSLKMMVR